MRLVLPAHAGMARHRSRRAEPPRKFSPHTRGWPVSKGEHRRRGQRSPRTRGDGPAGKEEWATADGVLPAHAGMARSSSPPSATGRRFSPHTRGWPGQGRPDRADHGRSPRTRGDGPFGPPGPESMNWFSPHTRGWPGTNLFGRRCSRVLPAHAGMAR